MSNRLNSPKRSRFSGTYFFMLISHRRANWLAPSLHPNAQGERFAPLSGTYFFMLISHRRANWLAPSLHPNAQGERFAPLKKLDFDGVIRGRIS
jgi:hypothetical protein